MRRFIIPSLLLLSAFFLSAKSVSPIVIEAEGEIKWYSFEEALELNKTEKRLFFIDVYTDWCGWCKVMDNKTFSNPTIAKYLNENYYPVKFDAEQKEDIEFNGNTFKFVASGRKGYHELAAALLNGKLSYPTVVFLIFDEEKKTVQPIPVPGYRKPEDLDPLLKYFGDDHYQSLAFDQYQKEIYKSPFSQ